MFPSAEACALALFGFLFLVGLELVASSGTSGAVAGSGGSGTSGATSKVGSHSLGAASHQAAGRFLTPMAMPMCKKSKKLHSCTPEMFFDEHVR